MQETLVLFLGWEGLLRRGRLPTSVLFGFPGGSHGKKSTCNEGDLGLIPGLGRALVEGNGDPLQYSCLENHHKQMGYICEESDMTEQLGTAQHRRNY